MNATAAVIIERAPTPARRAPVFDFVPSRLKVADAAELRWFLDDPPIARVSASSFGASIARMQLFGHGSKPCLKCGGDRKRGRAGTGFSPLSGKPYRQELAAYRRRELKALGYAVVRDAEGQREIFDLFTPAEGWALAEGYKPARFITREQLHDLFPSLPIELCRPCKGCGCRGVEQRASHRRKPITARPTGNSVPVGSSEASADVDGPSLIRWVRVDKRLARAETLDPGSRRALETYFDPAGGSIQCLWLLTEAGNTLVEKTPNPMNLPLEALLHNEREAQRKGGRGEFPERAAMHARATNQATELFDRACRAWNVAGLEGHRT